MQGCGTVHMTTHDEAEAARAALDNKHRWQGMESPMVVRWVDRELQKRRRETRHGALCMWALPGGMMGEGGGDLR